MVKDEYWYWATNIKNIGYVKLEKLLDYFGDPESIYKADRASLCKTKLISVEDAERIIVSKDDCRIFNELNQIFKKNIKFLHPESQDYPGRLKNIYMKPFSLYLSGELPEESVATVAIIGARNATLYGEKIAADIASSLSNSGVSIISGMASGIDSAAQWGTIRAGGKTFSVLGSGIDVCYPKENFELFENIKSKGGIISEYPPGVPAESWHFPLRNRIISGLSDKIIVVEAKERSGTCITVDYALEQGKDVYAVPGRITDKLSEGCNQLIKQGANIFTGIKDIVSDGHEIEINTNTKKPIAKDLEVLYAQVDFLPKSLNNIIEETGLESKEVIKGLTRLELMDLVHEPIKNHYSRKG